MLPTKASVAIFQKVATMLQNICFKTMSDAYLNLLLQVEHTCTNDNRRCWQTIRLLYSVFLSIFRGAGNIAEHRECLRSDYAEELLRDFVTEIQAIDTLIGDIDIERVKADGEYAKGLLHRVLVASESATAAFDLAATLRKLALAKLACDKARQGLEPARERRVKFNAILS